MKTVKDFVMTKKWIQLILFLPLFVCATGFILKTQFLQDDGVKLVRIDNNQEIEVYVNGKLFTIYQYPINFEKPFLFPVFAPDGSVITRGFPIEPRKGERVDHPHHIGIWFNFGNVNNLDFWNNSSAVPASKKDSYGHIVVQKILKAESGKTGLLEVVSGWVNNKGNTLLIENTKYIFSGDKNSRTIDHIATLTAVSGPVTIYDCKEGLFAIRVDRAFEMPSNDSLILTDDKGNPATVKAIDNTGVTGMYTSSTGLKGDAVWGTRNKWVILSGVKDNILISIALFDNPKNPGYPAYAHARRYGLFSLNNLGQNSFDPKQEKVVYTLKKGESMKLYHRFYVQSGSELTQQNAEILSDEFSKTY